MAILFALLTLWLTRPWYHDPLGLLIAHTYPQTDIVAADAMLSLSLGGWFRFAVGELHQWPLASSLHLMFPCGAAHGVSYDGFLISTLIGLGWCVVPLGLAYNLALLSGVWAMGFVMYRLGNKLWGRGWISLAIGVCALCMPYLQQRLAAHPNLVHVWVLPAAIHLHLNWLRRPTCKRAAAMGGGIVLLAASSWYVLIMGMLYVGPALLLDALRAARRDRSDPAEFRATLLRFGIIAAVAVAGILIMGGSMLLHAGNRRTFGIDDLAPYSVPLVQWLLPFPSSWLGMQPWAQQIQARVGTSWEGLAGGPVAALLLMALYWWPIRRGRSEAEARGPHTVLCSRARLPLGIALVAALIVSVGPYLQITQVLPSGSGIKMPTWYLGKISHAFLIFRVPGRVHPLVNVSALLAAGCVLARCAAVLRSGRAPVFAQRAVAAIVLLGFTALNLAASTSFLPYPVTPVPAISPFHKQLSEDGGGAVLDVPGSHYWLPHYNYDQLFHHRPVVRSTFFHDALLPENTRYLTSSVELELLSDAGGNVMTTATIARTSSSAWLDQLNLDGIEYIIIHPAYLEFLIRDGYLPASMRDVYATLERAWSERLVYQDDLLRAYRTRPR